MSARVKLVEVRLSGDEAAALAAVLVLLTSAAPAIGAEVAGQPRLYENRRDPGCRVYLKLLVQVADEAAEDQRGTTHSRQAIRRPATPITAKDSRRRHLP